MLFSGKFAVGIALFFPKEVLISLSTLCFFELCLSELSKALLRLNLWTFSLFAYHTNFRVEGIAITLLSTIFTLEIFLCFAKSDRWILRMKYHHYDHKPQTPPHAPTSLGISSLYSRSHLIYNLDCSAMPTSFLNASTPSLTFRCPH